MASTVSSSTRSVDPTTTTPAERRSSEPSQPRSELTPSTTPSDRPTPDLPGVARSPARPADTPDHGYRPLDTRPRDEHSQPPDIDRHRPPHRRIGHDAAPRPRRRTPVRPPDRQTAAVFGGRRPTRPLSTPGATVAPTRSRASLPVDRPCCRAHAGHGRHQTRPRAADPAATRPSSDRGDPPFA